MNKETIDVVGKITHTYLFALHKGEVVHRNMAAKLVAEELGLIDEQSPKDIVELTQDKLMPLLDVLLQSGFLLSRPQKSVMISPKGLDALIDHEGTFPRQFLETDIPQALALDF